MNLLTETRQRLESTSIYVASLLVFFIAILVRISLIFVLKPYHNPCTLRVGTNCTLSSEHRRLRQSVCDPNRTVSPGYTITLAALFHLFGTGTAAEILKELLACIVSAASCALIPAVAAAFSLQANTGLVAGMLCALFPVEPLVQIDGDWEAPVYSLFLLALSIAVMNQWMKRDSSHVTALKLGLFWGVALLFSSVLLPLFVFVLITGSWLFRHLAMTKYLASAAIQGAAALLCLLPWIVRNQIALGSPIATRSNFGIELPLSDNDEATPDQKVNYNRGVCDHFHPLQNPAEAARVRQVGEVT